MPARPAAAAPARRHGFTLVEVLIVVVILGLLAALVVANFRRVTEEAKVGTTRSELARLEHAIEVFRTRNNQLAPALGEDGTLPELTESRQYLADMPLNAWVGGENARVVREGAGPDAAWHNDYGWIYDPATGSVWAAGFGPDGEPLTP